jgi:tRNA pseudouridine55 synthase
MQHGILLIDKQPSCTSHDVVQDVRRAVGQRKVGHCGTLDPIATGLLVMTLGKATRLTRFFIRAPKVYEGRIVFGAATDTYDSSGKVVSTSSTAGLESATVEEAMRAFEGTYEQAAPPYSAKKVNGVKYYELARRGEEVPEALKEITVFELRATGPIEEDHIPFRLSCSSGTYVRTLAHDLGKKVGCGANLAELRRLQVGPFKIEESTTIDDLRSQTNEEKDLEVGWVAFDDIPLPFDEVAADARQERRITHGQTVLVRQMESSEGDWIKLVNQRRQLIAVGTVIERIGSGRVGVIQPRIVFG